MSLQPDAPSTPAAPAASPSLLGRAFAMFAKPASAWAGLSERSQWWFPLLVMLLAQVLTMAVLYERALVPDFESQWEAQIEAGAMQPQQVDRAEEMMTAWPMRAMIIGFAGLGVVLVTLLLALVMSFGVGFVLGGKLPFRLALEVSAWASLVRIVEFPLFLVLAWTQESVKSVHLSFATFLPAADPPARWHTMLTVLLDATGPFSIWFVVVAVLGCSALSGVPRRSVAWVLGGLAVALAVVSALLAGWLSPAS